MKKIAELQARTDPLTGLPNRRAFFEVGSYAFQNAKRNKEHLSLLMLDIDKFKSINDTYGHATGDVVLKQLAEMLINLLRTADLCARIGGEEFAILMGGTDLIGAVAVAEKIRLHIKSINVTAETASINFTTSFGVADISSDHFQLEALLRDADIALYEAKGQGRDRVVTKDKSSQSSLL